MPKGPPYNCCTAPPPPLRLRPPLSVIDKSKLFFAITIIGNKFSPINFLDNCPSLIAGILTGHQCHTVITPPEACLQTPGMRSYAFFKINETSIDLFCVFPRFTFKDLQKYKNLVHCASTIQKPYCASVSLGSI